MRIEVLLNNPTMFDWWPKDIPQPSLDEYKAAELRYKKTIRKNDISDYRSGLCFVMSTYHPFIWLRFFFPYPSLRLSI